MVMDLFLCELQLLVVSFAQEQKHSPLLWLGGTVSEFQSLSWEMVTSMHPSWCWRQWDDARGFGSGELPFGRGCHSWGELKSCLKVLWLQSPRSSMAGAGGCIAERGSKGPATCLRPVVINYFCFSSMLHQRWSKHILLVTHRETGTVSSTG